MSASIYLELLRLTLPEWVIVLTAFAVLATDLFVLADAAPEMRRRMLALLASAGTLIAVGGLLMVAPEGDLLTGMFVADPISRYVKVAVLALLVCVCALAVDQEVTADIGEYYAMLLFSACGMMLLVSSENLLMIFLSLELTSLCLYILVGFDKRDALSAEAALKYFLFGATTAAFTLFGISLLYGVSGTLHLPEVAAAICRQLAQAGTGGSDPLVLVGVVMTLVGFAFKITAAPFHLWAPDVYQGARIPPAAFVASGSKVASFFVLGRLLWVGLRGSEGAVTPGFGVPGWMQVLTALAVLSLLLGNLAALAQTSVRRLLAYSAVAHAGYMLLAFLSADPEGLTALVYYSVTYAFATVGAFGIVALVESQAGHDGLEAFSGLGERSPGLAMCMLVFLLSLAGIPPLAGFFGKFYVFAAALNARSGTLQSLWIVALAVALSAVSLYYYLRVLKHVYVIRLGPGATPSEGRAFTRAVVVICAAATVVLGCFPNLLVGPLSAAVRLAGF